MTLPPLKPSKASRRLFNNLMMHSSAGSVSPDHCIDVTSRLGSKSEENKHKIDVVSCLVELIEEGWVKPTPDGGVYVLS